jgi:hypothetical protein
MPALITFDPEVAMYHDLHSEEPQPDPRCELCVNRPEPAEMCAEDEGFCVVSCFPTAGGFARETIDGAEVWCGCEHHAEAV